MVFVFQLNSRCPHSLLHQPPQRMNCGVGHWACRKNPHQTNGAERRRSSGTRGASLYGAAERARHGAIGGETRPGCFSPVHELGVILGSSVRGYYVGILGEALTDIARHQAIYVFSSSCEFRTVPSHLSSRRAKARVLRLPTHDARAIAGAVVIYDDM